MGHLTGASIAYDDLNDMMKISSMQKKFRDNFAGTDIDPKKWNIVQVGAGQSYNVLNGELNVNLGTTLGSETIIESKDVFTISFRSLFSIKIPNRLAENEIYLEVVSVDDKRVIDNKFLASWMFDGTVNTTSKYQVQTETLPRLSATQAGGLVSSSYAVYELELFTDEVWFHQRNIDSTSGRVLSQVRHQQIPDPNKLYKMRLRFKNIGTPASNTIASLNFITAIDYAELTTEITASRGGVSSGQALPVQVSNTPTAISRLDANNVSTLESTTNLTANQTYYTGSKDMGGSWIGYNAVRVMVNQNNASNFPAHVGFEQSTDGATFRETHRIPLPADNQFRVFEFPVLQRYVRAKVINGNVSGNAFYCNTTLVRSHGTLSDENNNIPIAHSITPLASGGTFTSQVLNFGGNRMLNTNKVFAFADQPGAVFVDQSRDGSVWRTTAFKDVVANQVVTLDDPIVLQYVRVRFNNSGNAQTQLDLHSYLKGLS